MRIYAHPDSVCVSILNVSSHLVGIYAYLFRSRWLWLLYVCSILFNHGKMYCSKRMSVVVITYDRATSLLVMRVHNGRSTHSMYCHFMSSIS